MVEHVLWFVVWGELDEPRSELRPIILVHSERDEQEVLSAKVAHSTEGVSAFLAHVSRRTHNARRQISATLHRRNIAFGLGGVEQSVGGRNAWIRTDSVCYPITDFASTDVFTLTLKSPDHAVLCPFPCKEAQPVVEHAEPSIEHKLVSEPPHKFKTAEAAQYWLVL